MTGYHFAVTCLCGGELHHRASGAVYTHNTSAIAFCTRCGSSYRLDLRLSVLDGPAIRHTLPPEPLDHGRRNPDAPGAALIDAIMAVAP